MKTVAEAVRGLRGNPQYADLIRDAYLGEDNLESARRFLDSGEFRALRSLIGARVRGGAVLDLGAGNGIASYCFIHSGAKLVYALEPDPDDDIGRGAARRLCTGLQVEVVEGVGEAIPLPDKRVDIVYARQVLHHTRDLERVLRECARVLKPGGFFLACREHVVDDSEQLRIFLEQHPVHRLTGTENAFTLDTYVGAILASGLTFDRALGPWDSVINAFPAVRTQAELEALPRRRLERRLGYFGGLASFVPGIRRMLWARINTPTPGRLYSFLASKPA